MKNMATLTINTNTIKQFYLNGCKQRSIKPRRSGLKDFVAFLEGDASYWMNANLKFFFEQMNH